MGDCVASVLNNAERQAVLFRSEVHSNFHTSDHNLGACNKIRAGILKIT